MFSYASCYSTYIEAPGVQANFEAQRRAILRGMTPASVVDRPDASLHAGYGSGGRTQFLAGESLAETSHAAAGLGNLQWSISTVSTIPKDCVPIHAAEGTRALVDSKRSSSSTSKISIARGVDCGYGYGFVGDVLSSWTATRADVDILRNARSYGYSYSNMIFGFHAGNVANRLWRSGRKDCFELHDAGKLGHSGNFQVSTTLQLCNNAVDLQYL